MLVILASGDGGVVKGEDVPTVRCHKAASNLPRQFGVCFCCLNSGGFMSSVDESDPCQATADEESIEMTSVKAE